MLTERDKAITRGVLAAVKDVVDPLRAEIVTLKAEIVTLRREADALNANAFREIAVLKARLDERPIPKDGRDGKDADHAAIERAIERAVSERVARAAVGITSDVKAAEDEYARLLGVIAKRFAES